MVTQDHDPPGPEFFGRKNRERSIGLVGLLVKIAGKTHVLTLAVHRDTPPIRPTRRACPCDCKSRVDRTTGLNAYMLDPRDDRMLAKGFDQDPAAPLSQSIGCMFASRRVGEIQIELIKERFERMVVEVAVGVVGDDDQTGALLDKFAKRSDLRNSESRTIGRHKVKHDKIERSERLCVPGFELDIDLPAHGRKSLSGARRTCKQVVLVESRLWECFDPCVRVHRIETDSDRRIRILGAARIPAHQPKQREATGKFNDRTSKSHREGLLNGF